jgi:hypothetical protein
MIDMMLSFRFAVYRVAKMVMSKPDSSANNEAVKPSNEN